MKPISWIALFILVFVGYLAYLVFLLIEPVDVPVTYISSNVVVEEDVTSSRSYLTEDVPEDIYFQEAEDLDPIEWDEVVQIKGFSLKKKNIITTDIVLQGTAPGYWFNEGDAPAFITNEQGDILVSGRVVAQLPWMTTEEIPFIIELDVQGYEDTAAWLLLERSNPSGLDENAAHLRFPIMIQP